MRDSSLMSILLISLDWVKMNSSLPLLMTALISLVNKIYTVFFLLVFADDIYVVDVELVLLALDDVGVADVVLLLYHDVDVVEDDDC